MKVYIDTKIKGFLASKYKKQARQGVISFDLATDLINRLQYVRFI